MKPSYLAYLKAGAVASGMALLSVASLVAPQSAFALDISAINDEDFFTVFNDTGGNGVAGQVYAPSTAQNPIGDIVDFGSVGRVSFINSPPYYLVNPNAWAFNGLTQADILFNEPIGSVSLAVRGTTAGDLPGPNGLSPFQGVNVSGIAPEPFLEAVGEVFALDLRGNPIGSSTPIENLDLKGAAIAEINFTVASLGQPIGGLRFVQNTDSTQAALFVGGLGVTPIPFDTGAAAGTILPVVALFVGLRVRKQMQSRQINL